MFSIVVIETWGSKMKKINGVYRNQQMHWVGDGFPVKNLFSYDRLGQMISPFLLLDYAAPYTFSATQEQRGVGSHPHRGFETVTIAYQGEVEHKDSHGGGGVIKAGDVQWMTAGAGLVHQEFHSSAYAQRGGVFEMVQLWVNLPAKDKMTTPRYQALNATDIAVHYFDDQGSQLRVIAGEYQHYKGVAATFSPINVWDVTMQKGVVQHFEVPAQHNTIVVVLHGNIQVNTTHEIKDHSIVLFAKDGETEIVIEATEATKFLVLTGEALNEPIEGYGPFVMNNQAEIMTAFADFNQGKFGQIAAEIM